jgi:hypothetical protein
MMKKDVDVNGVAKRVTKNLVECLLEGVECIE